MKERQISFFYFDPLRSVASPHRHNGTREFMKIINELGIGTENYFQQIDAQ